MITGHYRRIRVIDTVSIVMWLWKNDVLV